MMNNTSGQGGTVFNPFPGLRPFTSEESHLFFGREGQSRYVLQSLEKHHFVAVIGASGSGKSSLIYCGVIPGLDASTGKEYIAVSMRPGNQPLRNLMSAVSEHFNFEMDEDAHRKLMDGTLSLAEWTKGFIPAGKKLLVVVDQFEEIFRYHRVTSDRKETEEIDVFVSVIHEACTNAKTPISSVITMRSDFIGECSVYQDLTALINQSNYLIPQMTREDFRKAIEGPVGVGGATIDPELTDQLLDELGEDSDQLPVLQHALMRTWEYWQLQHDPEKPISIGDYEAIGRMEKALSDHANEAFDELNEEQRLVCEQLFKTITEKGGDNRGIRRPSSIQRIADITGTESRRIIEIADVFRSGSRTFLTPYRPSVLDEHTVLDISHESLMRIWDRLRLWVDEEAASVQMYRKLSEAAALYQEGTVGLWRPPDLQLALNWREKQQPTVPWAVQYDPAFERAMVFLETSDAEFRKEEENKVRLQKRRLRVTRIFSLVLGGIAVVAMGLFLQTKNLQSREEAARKDAENKAEEARIAEEAALAARDSADLERQKAENALQLAEERRVEAENATLLAEDRRIEAESERTRAEQNADAALRAQEQAQRNAEEAEQQRNRALQGREEAQKRRMLSIARSMAVKSLQIESTDDPDLKALLSCQAYLFNLEYGGNEHDADIYAGLYDARKALVGENYNVFTGHSQSVKSVVFEPGTNKFFSAGSDGKILQGNLDGDLNNYTVLTDAGVLLEDLAISPDGKLLAAGTYSEGIQIYTLPSNGEAPEILPGHDGSIRDIEFGGHHVLYSIGIDNQVLKWNIDDKTFTVVDSSDSRYNDMAVSPDGKLVAVCNRSGDIMVISMDGSGKRETITGPEENPVISLDFSNNGGLLAAGDQRGNVRLFETGSWTLLNSLRGSSARIESVSFSPGDRYLASSSYDGKVLFWDVQDLNISPVTLEDNRGFVFCVAFNSDETELLSGSNSLKVRPVNASELTSDFCRMITRNLTQDEWEMYVGPDIGYARTCPDLN